MVTQIWSARTDIIFCYFRPFFALLFQYWPRKLKLGKKCKKTPGDITLLHIGTINQDHTHPWYDVWFLSYEVQQTALFCHLGQLFALSHPSPSTPPNKPKNDIKNEKNLNKMEISSFYTSVPKTLIIRYVPEMWRETDVIAIFILGHTFTFYSPNSPEKRKFRNNEKKPRGIIILHKCTKNHDQMLHCSCILVRVGWNYFLFKAISMSFHPRNSSQKWTFHKNEKSPGDIII